MFEGEPDASGALDWGGGCKLVPVGLGIFAPRALTSWRVDGRFAAMWPGRLFGVSDIH